MANETQQTQVKTAEAEGKQVDSTTGEIKPETKTEGQGNVVPTGGGATLALPADQLAMMKKHSGKQQFTVRELHIPVFKLANTTTAEFKKSDPLYIKGIEEGDFFDNLTRQVRKGPIDIIVVRFMTIYIESKPNMGPTVKQWGQDRSGYDRAVGGDVGVRVTKDGNEIREVGSYYILVLNNDGTSLPSMMYLGSTAWKEARRLNALLGSLEIPDENGDLFVAPPYARVFRVTSVPDANEKNTWMAMSFSPGPLTLTLKNGMGLYTKANKFEEAIDRGMVKVQGEADDDRRVETEGRKAEPKQGPQGGPPGDEPPPPASENDYGGGGEKAQPGGSGNATVNEKAKNTPF